MSQSSDGETPDSGDLGQASEVLAALGLTIDATDQEIEAAARHLDPEAPEAAVEAIQVIIEAIRAEEGL